MDLNPCDWVFFFASESCTGSCKTHQVFGGKVVVTKIQKTLLPSVNTEN